MPTPIEIEVMSLLTSVDARPDDIAARVIAGGSPAVTVVCEAALGSYPGIRTKVRTNAIALLGWLPHPQAAEAMVLLVGDSDPDVAIRAMRAVGRTSNDAAVEQVTAVLGRPETASVVAAEAVRALVAVGSPSAISALDAYRAVSASALPHRGTAVVHSALNEGSQG